MRSEPERDPDPPQIRSSAPSGAPRGEPRGPGRLDATDRWVVAALVVAAFVLRAAMLGTSDLWSDEVHTFRTMALPLGGVVDERLQAGHVPLYFVLLRAWTVLAGLSQTALRLPSAIAGAALVLPAFLLFRRLVPAAAARWGAALVAVHPVFVELSREARMYSLMGLLFVVLAESAIASLDDGRVRARFWIAAALGPIVHPSWAFAVAPFAVWIWATSRCAAGRREGGSEGGSEGEGEGEGEGGGGHGGHGDGDAEVEATRRAATRLLVGLGASVLLLVVLLVGATPQHQVLTRRSWPLEVAVFALRPYLTSRPSDWFPTAGLAILAWAAALGVGWRAAGPGARARTFGVAMLVGIPVASAASGLIGGVPWGPARYVHLAALGAITIAAGAGTPPAGPAPLVGVAAFLRIVGAAGRGFLVATLFLLTLMVVGRSETAWSDAAARIRRDVPPGETVWVDDESARLVLAHYLGGDAAPVPASGEAGHAAGGEAGHAADRGAGRASHDVRVGRPSDGAAAWRARLVTDPLPATVEVERLP